MPTFTKDEKLIIVLLCAAVLIGAAVRGYKTHFFASHRAYGEYEFEGKRTALKAVNINTAGREDLLLLDGIGPALADRIVSYREKNGRFASKENIMNVKGIGQRKFDKIKDRIITVPE